MMRMMMSLMMVVLMLVEEDFGGVLTSRGLIAIILQQGRACSMRTTWLIRLRTRASVNVPTATVAEWQGNRT